MNIFFDLDGPIIDVSERYYQAYLASLRGFEASNIRILDKVEFWELKRNRITDFEIGLISGLGVNDAKVSGELRRDLTFKNEFLIYDKLFEDVYKTFDYLKIQSITFFLITLRRKTQLLTTLKQFKLDKYVIDEFTFSIANNHKITNDIQEKNILLIGALNKLDLDPKDCWLVGDTDTDIFAGRLAKISKVFAITRGIRSKIQLQFLNPDYLIDDLFALIKLAKELLVKN